MAISEPADIEYVCSLAQDFSLDLAPHVLPRGRAGCTGIQGGAPALDFSSPRRFDLGRFSLWGYVQALDQPGCDFRAFLLGKGQRILQDSVSCSSHKTHYSTGHEANQTASGDHVINQLEGTDVYFPLGQPGCLRFLIKNFTFFSRLLWRIFRRPQFDEIRSRHGHVMSVTEARK